ncbi:hypothetical protein BDR04DRAFT_1017181, partial [Suillus decipiens]
PNEKQHSPIKHAYLHQSNCKDIANQVLSYFQFSNQVYSICFNLTAFEIESYFSCL